MARDAPHLAAFDHYDLAGTDVALKPSADRCQRHRLRSEHDGTGLGDPTHAQRLKAMRIANRDQFRRGHQDQRIRAFQNAHGLFDSRLDGRGHEALSCNDVRDYLSITCRMKDAALLLQLASQRGRIDQVSVVRDRQLPFDVLHQHGLCVFLRTIAARGVTHMADGHIARSQMRKTLSGEDLAHQTEILITGDHTPLVHRDARGFLAAMLQGHQAVIHDLRYLPVLGLIDAEHTAFFVHISSHTISLFINSSIPSNNDRLPVRRRGLRQRPKQLGTVRDACRPR